MDAVFPKNQLGRVEEENKTEESWMRIRAWSWYSRDRMKKYLAGRRSELYESITKGNTPNNPLTPLRYLLHYYYLVSWVTY